MKALIFDRYHLSCFSHKFKQSLKSASDLIYHHCRQQQQCLSLTKGTPPFLHQFSSVAQSCPTFCDPMDCSIPGLPVHHQLLESTQTHVHWVGDAIQPSHPLSAPSPPTFNLSQHQGLFQMSQLFASGGQSIGVSASASVLPVNTQDWSPLGWTAGSPCSPRDSRESSPTPQFKSINSSVLSFLYSPTLTSIHDHWKNHSLD